MRQIQVLEGKVVAPEGLKVGIIASRFNEIIVNKLLGGAVDGLVRHGVSSRYIKEIENHGNVPSIEKLGQLIRALHISADPFFYPDAPADNLDYKRLLVYLSQCTEEQITTILAIVEAYLRTYKHPKE